MGKTADRVSVRTSPESNKTEKMQGPNQKVYNCEDTRGI